MNKTVRNVGLAAIAAGMLYYPAMRLYKAWAASRNSENPDEHGEHNTKLFAPAYRGEAKAHNRKADANGRMEHKKKN